MLKRNNSIVKDTLSKIWKLCSILKTNMLHIPLIATPPEGDTPVRAESLE
jgi:hypothetical protein